MAVSVIFPVVHVEDANGLPYVGARMLVYEAGTTTLRPIFTDAALATPAANPVISNAKGDFPRVYTAPGLYKVRLEQAIVPPATSGVLISEADNIDSGLSAGTVALEISRGGTGATTAAAARANLDVPSNSELTALSTQIASLASQVSSFQAAPQGILSLASNTKIITSDVVAGTSIWYTEAIGNQIPVYDGAVFQPRSFSNLQLALNANHIANGIYDCFVIWDNGIPVIVTGPIWNTVTAGSGARGTGGGTTELESVNGILVNKYAMLTARNGATLYSVNARQGTFVGSFPVDGTNGQISQHVSYGQSRRPGPWNAYNRHARLIKAGDPTSNWTYATATVRASNAASANKLTVFCGLPEEYIDLRFQQQIAANGNNTTLPFIGFGLNSTTAITGPQAVNAGNVNTGSVTGLWQTVKIDYALTPRIGLNDIQALESGSSGVTFFGTEKDMTLSAWWNA